MITIRAALPADAEAIIRFWNPIIRDTAITFTTVEHSAVGLAGDIAARLDQGLGICVAEVEGQVCGFARYGPFRSGPGYKRTAEHTIVLAPEVRGQGLGRRLMAAIEEHAAGAGITTMIAGVSGENPDGYAFHRRVGYDETGRLTGVGYKFGRVMDLVLMQKTLSGF